MIILSGIVSYKQPTKTNKCASLAGVNRYRTIGLNKILEYEFEAVRFAFSNNLSFDVTVYLIALIGDVIHDK